MTIVLQKTDKIVQFLHFEHILLLQMIDFIYFSCRCLWIIRRGSHRKLTGKISMCPGRVLPYPVPQPTHQVRQTSATVTFSEDCFVASHRAVVFRQVSGQNAHRNAHKGHATQWKFFQLALHAATVTSAVSNTNQRNVRSVALTAARFFYL